MPLLSVVLLLPLLAAWMVSTAHAAPASQGARAEASSLMSDRCAVCHGPAGTGDGPAASSLNPKPQNFQSRRWQRSVTDATLVKVIIYGGPAAGLSASMPGNPDLAGRPEVVAAIVEQIRKLAK